MFDPKKMILKAVGDFISTFLASYGASFALSDGNLKVSISTAALSAVWVAAKNWFKNRR